MTIAAQQFALITDATQMMYRQMHPNWIVNSRVSSMAFRPSAKDNKKLSVRTSAKTTAEGAYKFQVETLGLKSLGSWGISIEEVFKIEMKCFESPITTVPQDPSHCHIDFAGLSNRETQDKADKLANYARARGALYTPPESTSGE